MATSEGTPVEVTAPMCVHAVTVRQKKAGERLVIHLYNDLNTTAGHGHPAEEVPLREEVIPIGGIRVVFEGEAPRSCRFQPERADVPLRRDKVNGTTVVEVPALHIHGMLVADF